MQGSHFSFAPARGHERLFLALSAAAAIGCASAPSWRAVASAPHRSGPPVCAAGAADARCAAPSAEEQGRRAPGAIALLRVLPRIDALGVDGADLLFTADGHAFRMPRDGGSPAHIGLYLMLRRPGPGHAESAIVRVPMAGGPYSVIVGWGEVWYNGLAVDATDVYYSHFPAAGLMR